MQCRCPSANEDAGVDEFGEFGRLEHNRSYLFDTDDNDGSKVSLEPSPARSNIGSKLAKINDRRVQRLFASVTQL